MFFKNYFKQYEKQLDRAESLERKVKDLERKIQMLQAEAREKEVGDVATSKFMINFDDMKVFSLERMASNGTVKTIVGHWVEEPVHSEGKYVGMRRVTAEWTLYCSQAMHDQLVAEFVKWKAKK